MLSPEVEILKPFRNSAGMDQAEMRAQVMQIFAHLLANGTKAENVDHARLSLSWYYSCAYSSCGANVNKCWAKAFKFMKLLYGPLQDPNQILIIIK